MKRFLRFLVLALVLVLVAGTGAIAYSGYGIWWRAFLVPSSASIFRPLEKPGIFAVRGDGIDLPVLILEGTPEEMGRRHGEVLGPEIRGSLGEYLAKLYHDAGAIEKARAAAKTLEPLISADHRAEMKALAEAAGVPYEELFLANCSADLVVSLACSSLVATGAAAKDGKVVFGRNLDFPGYGILDGRSLLVIFRPKGKRAFAAPTWPGLVGIQSGMNEKGLCIADMVDLEADVPKPGVPFSLLMRAVLEGSDDVAGAVAAVKAQPLTVRHNLAIADAKTGLVLEVAPGVAMARVPSEGGLVLATNNTGEKAPKCRRFKCLSGLATEGPIDADRMRQLIASVSCTWINLHAMVFVPAERTLLFARGTTLKRASDQDWARIPLEKTFTAAKVEEVEVARVPATHPPKRYDDK